MAKAWQDGASSSSHCLSRTSIGQDGAAASPADVAWRSTFRKHARHRGGGGGRGEGWRRRQGLSVRDYRISAVSRVLACRDLASTSTFS